MKICKVIIGTCSVLLFIILIAIPIVSAILSKGWFLLVFEPIMIPCAIEMLCHTFEYIRMIEVKRRENNERE